MPFQGDINNPVPKYPKKENKSSVETSNRALDVRRDTDARKNFTVTLLDIDGAILNYIKDVINISVIDSGKTINVPIIYGSPERWKASQVDGFLRDQQGKIQLPIIMFKRTGFSKNESLMTFNRYLNYPVISKYSEKNKYDQFSVLNPTSARVHQIHAVTLPDHVKVEYEFMVWSEYVEHMNSILERINFAANDYWGDPSKFKFRININDYSNTTEVANESNRAIRTTFTITAFAYLLPESFEDRKQTTQKILTERKIKVVAETVINPNLPQKNNVPYYRINGVISNDGDTWDTPPVDLQP